MVMNDKSVAGKTSKGSAAADLRDGSNVAAR